MGRSGGKCGSGRRRVGFEAGDRSGETFLRLYERLPEAERCYSDDYGVYGSWLPAERHIVGKGKLANRNEGLHSKYLGQLEAVAVASAAGPKIRCQRVLKIPAIWTA